MTAKLQIIEVDETTAQTLAARAAERGISVAALVAELAGDESSVEQLDKQWREIEAGRLTTPHDRVVEWLETWGTARFRPWDHR